MLPVGGRPLLRHVAEGLAQLGVQRLVVVVAPHSAEPIERAVVDWSLPLRTHFVLNPHPQWPNGHSVLAAEAWVQQPTLLLMGDHLWQPQLVRRVAQAAPRVASGELGAALGVDRAIERCFDLEDATKVRLRGERIVAIGKRLDAYDALDTGVFCIGPELLQALRAAAAEQGRCSLSDGVRRLAEAGRMGAVDVGDAEWIDVDTPEAAAEAERRLRAWKGEPLAPRRGTP